MQKYLVETKVDQSKLYFHGSSEAKVDKLQAPSFRHPFYVTSDLHYAMAFCTKIQSQTGDYNEEKIYNKNPDENFVYVVTLKSTCKVFDFRDHTTVEFEKLFKLFDEELFTWISEHNVDQFDLGDIYEFCNAIQTYLMKPIDASGINYMTYTKLFGESKNLLEPRLFLKACSFLKKTKLLGKYDEYDTHQVMEPILKFLQSQGFHGVLTREIDFNDEDVPSKVPSLQKVTTSYAIGIFDKAGLDLMSLVPMSYKWLKKINPSYLQDKTNETADKKIRRFIKIYKQLTTPKSTIKESKIDMSEIWYFGNNRAKNLKISPPKWYAPFFLTTDFEYAENYSDYGVYTITLKGEAKTKILDFSKDSDVKKLHWPKELIDDIRTGKSDLNGIAYDMYILAGHGHSREVFDKSWYLSDAAYDFDVRSENIFDIVPKHANWASEKDHRFVLQMWKDIHDAGFDGFTHVEFGKKILALFDFKQMDKISVKPVSKQVNEASRLNLSDVLQQLKQQVNGAGARCDAIEVLNNKFHHNTVVLYGDFHDKFALDTLRFNYTNGNAAIGIDKGWYEGTRCMNKWRGVVKSIIDSLLPNGIEEGSSMQLHRILKKQFNAKGQYEPPYNLEQIKAKYPEHIYIKLANDPVHKWRAETGIELIHKEPTEEELDRIWKNWQLMPQDLKAISDQKCIEFFGCINHQHYTHLKSKYITKKLDENKATYLKKFQDEPGVKSIINQFWIIRNRVKSPLNDIDWWIKKPYSDFKNFVLTFDDRNKTQKKQDTYRAEALQNGAKHLDTKDGYEIWYVPTYESMVILGRFYKGRSAKWCVASDDPEFWYENHDEDEFVLLIRVNPQNDEFDKIALQMENRGRYFDEDSIIPWDLENKDWTFDRGVIDNSAELVRHAWELFKDNGELRDRYFE